MDATTETGESALDLAALARALWQRRRWIIVPTLIAAVASFAVVNLMTPRYKSESRVLIESRETVYNRAEGDRNVERDRTLVDAEAVQSQVQLALSRDLARKVVRELKLADRAEFNPEVSGSVLGRILALVGLFRDASRLSIEERVLDRYYERLTVYPIDKTRVIVIEFQSEDPDLAAKVANAVADGYLTLQQQSKQEAMRQASQWLSGEIERMRGRVAEAEGRVEAFRTGSNLYTGPNSTTLSAQQLGELNSQLTIARSQKADAEVKARLIREQLRSGRPIESSDVVNSELIRRLNEQRVTLKAQLAEQSSTLLPLHPRIKELRAQIGDLESQIRSEAEKLVRSFENDARVAGARVEQLSASLDQLKRQASSLGEQDVQLRALEREAKAQRDLLESYLGRYRDVTARESPDAVPADARIISRAVPTSTPYFPKKLPIVLLATLATLLFAVVFIAVGELMGGEVYRRIPWALDERQSQIFSEREPGELPEEYAPAAWRDIPQEPAMQPEAVENPASAHERRMAALFTKVSELERGVLVLGGVAPDGRPAGVAVELVRRLATQGARVLLLDLDVTHASSRALVADAHAPGISDLLFGVVSFTDAIQRDPVSRAQVIGLGRSARNTVGLLTAPRLAIVLGALSQTYDYVVVTVGKLPKLPGVERLARFARAAILIADEKEAGTELADELVAGGFDQVMVVAVGPDMPSPQDRAAA
ncbi:MAG TPA: Wzz/FepE/Etk N-terminal domain-containing protein [Xanthobacteraceae bacterium]|jgi:uncharacterized protein involved in exopolysaccharide biosynthesis/Mrp family chromosome partitioning ATPase